MSFLVIASFPESFLNFCCSLLTALQAKGKFPNKTACLVGRAIEAKLKPLSSQVKTLTVDNGKEFADHRTIDQTLDIQTCFADPYWS